jgi:hypothetical protein
MVRGRASRMTLVATLALVPLLDSIAAPAHGHMVAQGLTGAARLGHGLDSARFVPNRGQFDRRVRFMLTGPAASVGFLAGGPVFSSGAGSAWANRWSVRQSFVGGRRGALPVGRRPAGGIVSYFRGAPGEWVTGVPTFGSVVYRNVWPGIDVAYSTNRGALEYSFVVAPGAEAREIEIAYEGASARLTTGGALRVSTPGGRTFVDRPPLTYQVTATGRRVAVASAFELRNRGAAFGFRVVRYDRSLPLVIDPSSIGYAGYIGGSGTDQGLAIATDGDGNAYVVGQTKSDERTFPVKTGPDLTLNGQTDAFVCKVNPAGQMVYCGYIGGAAPDRGRGVAVDSSGDAYVYGWTRSRNKDGFPLLVGPDLTYNGGTSDTFIAKVNSAGTGLLYSGYIGGGAHDEGKAIAVDAGGAAYVTGGTKSLDMPVTPGSFGQTYAGDGDVFVAKVLPDGTTLDWLGLVGGTGSEHARGIGVAPDGSVSFAGTTESSQGSLPVKVGPDLTYNGGGGDAFVGRITPDGSALTYLGYVGGAGFDDARDGTVGNAGNLFLCGHTASAQGSFPVTVGPDLTYNGGKSDGFVAMVRSNGTLGYAGYVGGHAADSCYGMDVDSSGDAFLSGRTFSTQTSFPVKGGPDLTYNGGGDDFAAQVSAGGHGFVYCGYVGGSDKDVGWGLSLGPNGVAYLTGQTHSSQASFPEKGGPDLTYNGAGDAFVAAVTP